jgi:glycine/D-amino acid oxidase-like deaminating enzyme
VLAINTRRLDLFTQTPCTVITPPSTVTSQYTVQTPRGEVTTHHIIHATNGWTSHFLPGLRGKIFPFRGLMTAQRPGTGLSPPHGARAHVFHYTPGFDYLTQLPKYSAEASCEAELLFGGGAVQGGRIALSEVGVSDDSAYNMAMASYIQGALPEFFGRANWGAEGVPNSPRDAAAAHAGDADSPPPSPWASGRVKALWTGIMGFSADLQPWVGRVPSAVSGRAVPPPMPMPAHRPVTSASLLEKDAAVLSLAAPGEWVSAGYSGEGMVHAWLCAHALALMLLGLEEEQSVPTWFPDEFRLTNIRLKRATFERLVDRF